MSESPTWYRKAVPKGVTNTVTVRQAHRSEFLSTNEHLSGTYNVPGTALSTGDSGQTKQTKIPVLMGQTF